MANDSSTSGYLAPLGPQPADDDALDLLLQPVIAGVTGLDGTLVRRRGQAVPPAQPDRPFTWCSFAVTGTQSDINPTLVHDGAANGGQGASYVLRQETLEVTAVFYGPAARGTATLLRDGLNIAQNRDAMRAVGLAYVGMERITFVPDLQNTQFIRRADLVFRVRRMVVRTYAILNIESAEGTVVTANGGGTRPVDAPFDTEF